MNDKNSKNNKEKIGGFDVIMRIGKGSFGEVFLVEDENNQDKSKQRLVLKVLDVIDEENNTDEYNLQAKVCVNSPFIVKVHSCFNLTVNNIPKRIIAMEYCEKGNLKDYINNSPLLSASTIIKIFKQICYGLRELHLNKIIHRDLKSLNIFIKENTFKIGDFGSAKQLKEKLYTSTIIGTPYYLSPEICNELDYTIKTDIWCLGVILYEMITKKYPFVGDNLSQLKLRIVKDHYKALNKDTISRLKGDEETGKEGYELLECILNLCLMKVPEDRPSVFELIMKIESVNSIVIDIGDKIGVIDGKTKKKGGVDSGLEELVRLKNKKRLIREELKKEYLDGANKFEIDKLKIKDSDVNNYKEIKHQVIGNSSELKKIFEATVIKEKLFNDKNNKNNKDIVSSKILNIIDDKNSQINQTNLFKSRPTTSNPSNAIKINKCEPRNQRTRTKINNNTSNSPTLQKKTIKTIVAVKSTAKPKNLINQITNTKVENSTSGQIDIINEMSINNLIDKIDSNIKDTNYFLNNDNQQIISKLHKLIGEDTFNQIDGLFEEISLSEENPISDSDEVSLFRPYIEKRVPKSKLEDFYSLYNTLKHNQLFNVN